MSNLEADSPTFSCFIQTKINKTYLLAQMTSLVLPKQSNIVMPMGLHRSNCTRLHCCCVTEAVCSVGGSYNRKTVVSCQCGHMSMAIFASNFAKAKKENNLQILSSRVDLQLPMQSCCNILFKMIFCRHCPEVLGLKYDPLILLSQHLLQRASLVTF